MGWLKRGDTAMLALSDVELCAVGKAFDRAWDNFLRTGALTPKNLWDSRTILAARILRCAYYGERDEWRLARDAVSYLSQVTDLRRRMPGQPRCAKGAGRGRKPASPRPRTMPAVQPWHVQASQNPALGAAENR
jgi:hypothetical protein